MKDNTDFLENYQTATLGGGCFWCLEAIFNELKGIEQVLSGYSGGAIPNPTYKQVCTGSTGHAEVVQLKFDPQEISFKEILQVFFSIHDPTTLNRQGADIGSQYRSVIFYHNQAQQEISQETIAELESEKIWKNSIVTQLIPFEKFYVAEDYHQDYYKYNTQQPYCQAVITPKLTKFRKKYLERLKK